MKTEILILIYDFYNSYKTKEFRLNKAFKLESILLHFRFHQHETFCFDVLYERKKLSYIVKMFDKLDKMDFTVHISLT
jgi:hypothetical protein